MGTRTRKFIGMVLMVTYLALYALVAMAVGANYFVEANGLVQFVYYVLAGLAWVPLAMWIVWWMSRGDRTA